MIETESGHNMIRAVEENEDIGSVILRHDGLSTPSQKWFGGQFGLWEQMEEAITALYDLEPGTVIIDSASDMLGMAVANLSIQWGRGDKAFPSMLYGPTYGLLKDTLAQIRAYHNLICTVRLKPEWKGEEETGKMKREIWSQGNYLPETIINVSTIGRHRFFFFEKGKREGLTLYDTIRLKASDKDYENESKLYKTARWIRRAELKSKGKIEFDWSGKLTMEAMTDFVQSIRSKQINKQDEE